MNILKVNFSTFICVSDILNLTETDDRQENKLDVLVTLGVKNNAACSITVALPSDVTKETNYEELLEMIAKMKCPESDKPSMDEGIFLVTEKGGKGLLLVTNNNDWRRVIDRNDMKELLYKPRRK